MSAGARSPYECGDLRLLAEHVDALERVAVAAGPVAAAVRHSRHGLDPEVAANRKSGQSAPSSGHRFSLALVGARKAQASETVSGIAAGPYESSASRGRQADHGLWGPLTMATSARVVVSTWSRPRIPGLVAARQSSASWAPRAANRSQRRELVACRGRRDGVALCLVEREGTTSRYRRLVSMSPGLKHCGEGAVSVCGVDDQAGGVCCGYRRPRLLQPPLVVACLERRQGPARRVA